MASEKRDRFGVKFGVSPSANAGLTRGETPFQIAILGDFSGRSAAKSPAAALPELRPQVVDRDNFGKVFQQLGVKLQLDIPGVTAPTLLAFRTLDDFHPDRLFADTSLFGPLRDLRGRLLEPSTYQEAASHLRSMAEQAGTRLPDEATPTQPAPTPEAPAPNADVEGGSILDQALAATQGSGQPPAADTDIQRMIREIIKPYTLPGPDPQQTELVAYVDRMAARLMSAVLHQPDFQALEAAWRGLHFLVRRLETGAELKLFIVDISKQELAADLLSQDDLTSTRVYQTLVEQSVGTPGAQPWALFVGNYTFDRAAADIEFLGRMAKISAAAAAPFVAAASPHVVGCESFGSAPDLREWKLAADPKVDDAWQALRRLPEAAYLGLSLPRFLLRLPYGKETNPVRSFALDEVSKSVEHDDYLWGCGAFACAYLLAEAFCQEGWHLRPDDHLQLDNLPVHLSKVAGEAVVKPCAEALLTDRAAHSILAHGLMPLLSIKDRDMVRLGRFQSVADPATGLAGRWTD